MLFTHCKVGTVMYNCMVHVFDYQYMWGAFMHGRHSLHSYCPYLSLLLLYSSPKEKMGVSILFAIWTQSIVDIQLANSCGSNAQFISDVQLDVWRPRRSKAKPEAIFQ